MSYADEIKLWTTDAGARWLAEKVDSLEARLAATEKQIAECCGGDDAGRQPAPLAAKIAPAESAAKTEAESPAAKPAKVSSTDDAKAADSSKTRKRT